MKKTLLMFIGAILVLSLMFFSVSCGQETTPNESTNDSVASDNSDETEAPTESAENPVSSDEDTETVVPPDSTEDPVSTDEGTGTETPPEAGSGWPLLWRVTDGEGHTLYLFGTIHIGDGRNETVLEHLSPVFEQCDALAVEFDTVAYSAQPARMMQDILQYVLTDGTTITDHMPEELFNRASELLNRAGLTPALFLRYNVAWWSQLIDSAMVSLYSGLDSEKAMDSLLINRANEKGKTILEVESSDFQMALLNSFEDELYLMQIEESLNGIETYGEQQNMLYELWLSGDKDTFWAYLSTEGDTSVETNYTEEQVALIEDYMYKLLDERNIGMKDRAIEYLSSGDTVFFAVGAAHMANEAGLVSLLTDAGYTVEEIS